MYEFLNPDLSISGKFAANAAGREMRLLHHVRTAAGTYLSRECISIPGIFGARARANMYWLHWGLICNVATSQCCKEPTCTTKGTITDCMYYHCSGCCQVWSH